jgi:erythromycin esterase-like protein
LRRAEPGLRSGDPSGYDLAAAHARTALSLLRYHAVMASSAPDRVGTLLSVRAEMMADNLLAVAARERRRGPILVFAHNTHVQRAQSEMSFGGHAATWAGAGALVALRLGERYVVVASDGHPHSEQGTFQGVLAEATARRALVPARELRAALDPSLRAGEPMVRGHIPLTPAVVDGVDAVIFVTDTDGKQHQYW